MKKIRKSKYFCIVLCVALLLGIVYNPASVQASDTATEVKDVIIQQIDNISQYRGETKTAPTLDGYVFSGWRGMSEDGNYYVLEEAQADEAAKNGDTVYAKFVPIEVLSCMFQYKGGTTILSEDTTLRLVTSVDSKLYKSVGFKITMEGVTKEVDSRKVYSTISSNNKTYTPDVFSPISAYFSTTLLINIGFHVFEKEIAVTPFWVTKDGTKVYGQPNSVNLESRLATVDSNNLQANMGTDFEKMGIVEEEASWDGRGYFHNTVTDGGVVAIINDGGNTFARLRPVNAIEDVYYATLTKSCSKEIVSQKCKVQISLRTGSGANGELRLGIWAKIGEETVKVVDSETLIETERTEEKWEWVLPYRSEWKVINTTIYPSGTWVTLEKELDLGVTALQEVNMDFAYTVDAPDANNYVEIDNIKVLNENGTDIDLLAQDDFEGLARLKLNTPGWCADMDGRNVVFVEDAYTTNDIVVEGKEHYFKFYTETSAEALVNFAGNPVVATEAGYYKLTAKVKFGPGAINVANTIGFRLYWKNDSMDKPENLGVKDEFFAGLKRLNSLSADGQWMTMVAYFQVPEGQDANAVNIQFWAYTHNVENKDINNYVLMDDIEIYKVTPK